jgi:transcriptional regulator with XRE-family HTH domain
MKLNEKIRKVRKEKGMTMRALFERLKEIFGEKALQYNTLYRIEKGLRDARVASLSQICTGLGISLKELKEGTDQENISNIELMAKRDTIAQYVYSEKAHAQILTRERHPFLGLRLQLAPGGRTKGEQDPVELGKFEKWVYGLRGVVTCVIGKQQVKLKKDETMFFESTIPHHFQNDTPRKAVCLIVQHPKHI